MATIKVSDLLTTMLSAAKEVLDEEWPEVREHAKTELKGIAEGIVMIERLRLEDKITQKQARALIRMKQNTAQIVLLTIKGMGLLAVESAINAAIKAIQDTVNTALNFKLL